MFYSTAVAGFVRFQSPTMVSDVTPDKLQLVRIIDVHRQLGIRADDGTHATADEPAGAFLRLLKGDALQRKT